jgi:hypothetical protein
MNDTFAQIYLHDIRQRFERLKSMADRAIAQVDDQDLYVALDPTANRIALLIKHLAGNMRARWRDPFVSDGEQGRRRDSEFELEEGDTRTAILARWEEGWSCLFETLASLTVEDLERTIRIRSRSYSTMQVLNRQLAHYAGHVGQIVLLAKHFCSRGSRDWSSLSIPRGQSASFNLNTGKER